MHCHPSSLSWGKWANILETLVYQKHFKKQNDYKEIDFCLIVLQCLSQINCLGSEQESWKSWFHPSITIAPSANKNKLSPYIVANSNNQNRHLVCSSWFLNKGEIERRRNKEKKRKERRRDKKAPWIYG